jgi:pimeloyl-[acyl-carrier protein] methyl ester esterase
MWTLKPLVHPQAGHDLPLEDPQWVCDQLKNWPVLSSSEN